MSRHWKPQGTRWLSPEAYAALSPRERRALFAARAQRKREESALRSFQLIASGRSRSLPTGITVGLVLAAAACVGTAVGLYQATGPAKPVEPQPKIEWDAVQLPPTREAYPGEAEWAARAKQRGGPSTSSGQTVQAVRGSGVASFGYCQWGGGTNCVVDGDTFYLNGEKVRIAGIDAPETHPSRCAYEAQLGEQATEKLHALLNSGAVTMTSIDRDRDVYGRLLRDVQVNGADVGEAMVSAGVAREYAGGRRPWC